ncbi:MAG: helix-turn-helix transcriptional regulator, partial [Ilumatobacteraceae bacterium]
MNQAQLGEFLRNRRARIRPTDVGLPTGRRRRTAGLRREEVASLAAISVDYYTRLEQGRGPRPSRQVLGSLARALRLSNSERAYLVDLVGETRSHVLGPPADVPSGILQLLDRLNDTPAYVTDAKWDILAWNPMAAALMSDLSELPDDRRNAMRWLFEHLSTDAGEEGVDRAREAVADLLAAAARYPDDLGVRSLIAELGAVSALFTELWEAHDVQLQR